MKRFVVAAALSAVVLGWWSAPVRAQAPSTPEAEAAAELIVRINDLRSQQGLRPLAVHGELVAKATGWARTMAAAGRIWHSTLSDGITVDWLSLGENVGVAATAEALHQAFVNSPRHYENLVRPDFDSVGIGVARTGDVLYAAEVFMRVPPAPKAAAPTVSETAAAAPAPAAAAAPPAAADRRRVTQPKPAAGRVASAGTRAVAPPVRRIAVAQPKPSEPPADPTAVTEPPLPLASPPPSIDAVFPDVQLAGHTPATSSSAALRPLASGVAAVAWMAAITGLVVVGPPRSRRRLVSNRELRRLVGPLPGI